MHYLMLSYNKEAGVTIFLWQIEIFVDLCLTDLGSSFKVKLFLVNF